jgi:FKBP-type peptidyl-prolyl cis-trans isomerase FkpA
MRSAEGFVSPGHQAPAKPSSSLWTDLRLGTGAEAASGQVLEVHYLGKLVDGTKFDSSYDRGNPFTFGLGKGMVIKGWELGIVGMRVGGLRRLTLPPELAYGDKGAPPKIPAGATLVFDVELLRILP